MLYAEDFQPGRQFAFGSHLVTREEIVAFASEWDPLPMHTDERAAADGPFGDLIASGVHTMAIYQRLAVPAIWARSATIAGRTLQEVQMLRPVRPGMTLTGHAEVVANEPRRSGALVTFTTEIHEEHGTDPVLTLTVDALIGMR